MTVTDKRNLLPLLLLAVPEFHTFLLLKREFSIEQLYLFLSVVELFLGVVILPSSIISYIMSFMQCYVVCIYFFLFQSYKSINICFI
jgi:hypothetical protein